jgi:hemolysin activation/secretion protein
MVRLVRRRLSRMMVCGVGAFAGLAATHVRAQSAPGLPPGLPPPVAAPRPLQDPGQRLLQDQRNQQRSDEVQQAPAQIAVPEQSAIPNLPAGADIEALPDV